MSECRDFYATRGSVDERPALEGVRLTAPRGVDRGVVRVPTPYSAWSVRRRCRLLTLEAPARGD